MRDLYKRLGLSQSATQEQIFKALRAVNGQREREAANILLVGHRRRVYDRSYCTLKQIGKLRANFGLRHAPHWILNDFGDFDAVPRSGGSIFEQMQRHTEEQHQRASPTNGQAKFEDLPPQLRQRLLDRQQDRIQEQAHVQTGGVFWKYVWLLILCCWFWLLFVLADDHRWSSSTLFWFSAITLGAALIIGWQLDWIYKWHQAKLKCRLYVTPMYFIQTHLNEVRWWPLWNLQDIKITHNYRNGGYQHSDLKLKFPDETVDLAVSPKDAVEKWLNVLKKFDNQIREAAKRENWNYFSREDDFRGIELRKIEKAWLTKSRGLSYGVSLAVSAIILLAAYNVNVDNPSLTGIPPQRTSGSSTYSSPKPAFNAPAQPLPYNGTERRYYTGEGIAPLEIRTRGRDQHYFVKVTDWYSDRPILSVFIRAGQFVETHVPTGSYRLKYATGTTWYDENYLFGPETSYSKADSRFDFINDGYQVSGYTVELFLQTDGNLRTSRITPDQW